MTLLDHFLVITSTVVLTLLVSIYLLYKKKFRYWKDRNVYYLKPSIPFGNTGEASFKKNFGVVVKELYDQTKDHRYVGIWSLFRPILMINDPELTKNIFVRDFTSFHDRGVYVNEEEDPLAAHLFSLSGAKWRNLRVKLTPTFTSGKMKMMFQTFVDTSDNLRDFLQKPAKNREVLEVRDVLARYTTDVISSCAFGIETNSLKNPNSEFRLMGKKAFDLTRLESFKIGLNFVAPELARLFKLRNTKKEVEKFFIGAVKETIEYREKNNIKRNDFMQLIIQLKNKGVIDDVDTTSGGVENITEDKKFTLNEAAAQAFIFFVAGFETSSTTMQYALYELALNPDIQERTRNEIKKVIGKYNGKITYEGISEMEYLDRVVSETLRMYPPVGFLNRECTKEYKIPESDLILEKGSIVQIPVFGYHRDPQHFPDPLRFDPDRFTEEEKSKRHQYAYLPFGEGPRNCIGSRFGLLQTKVGLVALLSDYAFEVCDKTLIPMDFDAASFIIQPKGGMFLRITSKH